MGFGDFLGDVVDGAQSFAGGVVNGVQQFASDPIGTVAGVLGGGDPSGNDGGSSNWAAWGHAEIRSMLDNTVEPADIHEGARAWSELQTRARDLVTGATDELRNIVSNGWRGESAEAAIRSLTPVYEWANTLSAAMDNTAQLMDYSGSAADQAKAAVPEPVSHNWGRSLGGFALGGGPGALVDAVAQDRAQEEARAEAVRIMTNAYSAPINESRAVVPTYPQLADPTLRPPEQPPVAGPAPGAGSGAAGLPGGGGAAGGGAYQPPAVAGLQGAPRTSGLPGTGGPGQLGGTRPPGTGGAGVGPGGGGFGAGDAAAAAAAGVPLAAPLGRAGGDAERARRGVRSAGFGGGRPGGLGGRAGGGAGFGPRGSIGSTAGAAEGGRVGAGPGIGATAAGGAAGRGGVGGVPLAGAGAGRGQGGDDAEHRRPSYLVETDDVFGDGRRVAPPVIGEDPPEHYR